MEKIFIQADDITPKAKTWDDVYPVAMEVENPVKLAQDIADRLQCAVRLTRQWNNLPAGRLNGAYFQPKQYSNV